MDNDTKQGLDSYLKLLDEISEKTDNEETALALLQEIAKDRRMEQIREENQAKVSEPATDSQKGYMTDLGIEFSEDVTKQEASALIKQEISD